MEEAQNVSADGRLVRDCSKSELQNSLEFQDKGMINEIRGSSPTNDTLHQEPQGVPSGCSDALVDQDQDKVTSDGAASTVDIPTNITVTSTPVTDVKSDTCLSASSNPFLLIPPKSSSVKRTIKIMRQVVNRTQPVRYTGQFQNIQTGHTYFHPSPQNVFGRAGPLVCMHPIPSDVVHSAAGFSAAASRPALTPHQVHLPKHQGNASAQALQLYINPPIMANGPPSFVMPSSIPISQPVFPVLQQIAVPGTNGFLSSKLA